MSKIIKAVCAAALLVSVAACASSQAQTGADLTPPARKLDAKTQLECGKRC